MEREGSRSLLRGILSSWRGVERKAARPGACPTESLRHGTARRLTLFEASRRQRRVQGVTSTTHVVLHPWRKRATLCQAGEPAARAARPR